MSLSNIITCIYSLYNLCGYFSGPFISGMCEAAFEIVVGYVRLGIRIWYEPAGISTPFDFRRDLHYVSERIPKKTGVVLPCFLECLTNATKTCKTRWHMCWCRSFAMSHSYVPRMSYASTSCLMHQLSIVFFYCPSSFLSVFLLWKFTCSFVTRYVCRSIGYMTNCILFLCGSLDAVG